MEMLFVLVVRTERQVNLEPFSKTSGMVPSTTTGLSYMEHAHLGSHYQHLRVSSEVIKLASSQALYNLASSFLSKRDQLPRGMVLAHSAEPLLLIIYLLHLTQDREPITKKFLSLKRLLIVLARYKQAEEREAQMDRHKDVDFKDQQCLNND